MTESEARAEVQQIVQETAGAGTRKMQQALINRCSQLREKIRNLPETDGTYSMEEQLNKTAGTLLFKYYHNSV